MSRTRSMKSALRIMLMICGLTSVCSTAFAQTSADIRVLDVPITSQTERFGLNLLVRDFNNWTGDAGMEPFVLRMPGTASGGGTNYIIAETQATTSWWDTIGDGFFEGATVRVYRSVNGVVQPVTTSTVTQYFASPASGYRINLADHGPAIQAGDYFIVEMIRANPPVDRVSPRMAEFVSTVDTWRAVGGATWPYGQPVAKWRDTSTVAPEEGGLSSMTFTTTGTHEVSLRQYYYGTPGGYYPSLEQGRTYRAECWLRQVGVPSGQVNFRLSGAYSAVNTTWAVGSSWAKHTYDFVAPAPPPPNTGTIENILAFQGPGQVWVDNLRIYDPSYPAFAPRPEAVQQLHEFSPGNLRIWTGHTNVRWGTTLDDFLTSDATSLNHWTADGGRVVAENSWKLPLSLELCRQTSATPWLIIGPFFSEQEWRSLVEYLAGPAGTPYGDLRISHGQVQPWTEVFPRILLEFNNEGWNSIFTWRFPDGAQNGQFAEYFFNAARSSPHFPSQAGKIQFMVNGWIAQADANSFGHGAIAASTADYTNIATYIGGWESGGGAGGSVFNLQGLQRFLLYPPSNLRFFADAHTATRDLLQAALGRPYGVAVYEGGPGYPLPDPGANFDHVSEAYGKSLAAGTATLDTFLYCSLRGMDPQSFFNFTTGWNWSSHSNVVHGYRPHSTYLALQMRNRWARGQMLATAYHATPVANVSASGGVPAYPNTALVAPYVFRDGNDYSVFLLSRSADEDTTVRLRLPFHSATTSTLHRLAGDPRTSNTYQMNLQIESVPLAATLPEHELVLPAASIYLLQFQGTSLTPSSNPEVWVSRSPGQAAETTNPLVQFNVTFSQPITGFTASDIVLGGSAGAAEATVVEIEPLHGTNFRVSVSGMTSSGTILLSIPAGSAQNSSGTVTLASQMIDGGVNFVIPDPVNALFVYDPVDIAPASAPNPPFLHGASTGFGWAGAWTSQNFNAASYGDGYRIGTTTPLAFSTLVTTGSYLVGGRAYETSGRLLDVSSALADYQISGSSPALVGQTGRTLWISVLVRKEAVNDQPVFVSFNRSTAPWILQENRLAIGYFGTPSNSGGIRYWSLMVRNAANNGDIVLRSTIPVVVGETALLVARVNFGATDRASLYVNPASFGGAEPAVPDAEHVSTSGAPNMEFRSVGFYGGNALDQGAADEIRIGDSFRAVTPNPAIPVTLSRYLVE